MKVVLWLQRIRQWNLVALYVQHRCPIAFFLTDFTEVSLIWNHGCTKYAERQSEKDPIGLSGSGIPLSPVIYECCKNQAQVLHVEKMTALGSYYSRLFLPTQAVICAFSQV